MALFWRRRRSRIRFFAELKRGNAVRADTAQAAIGWLAAQLANASDDSDDAPSIEWSDAEPLPFLEFVWPRAGFV